MKYLKHLLLLALFIRTQGEVAAKTDVYKEIPRTNEKALRIEIKGSFETIYLNKGSSDKIVTVAKKTDDKSSGVFIAYTISNGIGYLEIDLDRNGDKSERGNNHTPIANASLDDAEEGDWYITLTDAIPIDFDLEFDVGKANVNFTGLQISKLSLTTGASKVFVKSNSVNSQTIESISIEAGLGKFTSERLGNLNFKKLSFEGGIGSYRLDLSGALRKDARIHTEVGMGSLTIILPKGVAVKMTCEDHWLTSCNFPRFVNRGDGVYHTENIQSHSQYISISAECGVGSISVKWSE